MTKLSLRWSIGWLIAALLHISMLYLLMQAPKKAASSGAPRNAIQWLLPLAPPARSPSPAAGDRPPRLAEQPQQASRAPLPQQPQRPQRGQASSKPAEAADLLPPPPASLPAPLADGAPAVSEDLFAQPAPARLPGPGNILQQAKLDVGRIDRELRVAYPEKAPTPLSDGKQARLERGINAAHEAVPPKWYQGARIVELSTQDGENKTRRYKIITALLTYCINVSADGRKSYTSCP